MIDGSWVVLGAVGSALFVGVLWWASENPDTLLYALLLYLPVEEFAEKWVAGGPPLLAARLLGEALLLVALAHLVTQRLVAKGRWVPTPIDWAFGAFLASAAVSAIANDVPVGVAILGLRVELRYVCAFYVAANLMITPDFVARFCRGLFAVAIGVCAIGLLQAAMGPRMTALLLPTQLEFAGTVIRETVRGQLGTHSRVFSTMGRYDTLGTFLAMVLILSLGIFGWADRSTRRTIRWLWVLAVPTLALTYSRQAWLALYAGVVAVAALRYGFLRTAVVALGPPLAILGLAYAFPEAVAYSSNRGDVGLLDRLLEPLSPGYIEISRYNFGRLYVILEVGSRILGRAMWLGFGPGLFGSLTSRALGYDSGALVDVPAESAFMINDVNWITLLGQVGILGVLAFLAMLVGIGTFALRCRGWARHPAVRAMADALVGMTVAFTLLGFFGPNLEVRQVSYYYWLGAGVTVGLAATVARADAAVAGVRRAGHTRRGEMS